MYIEDARKNENIMAKKTMIDEIMSRGYTPKRTTKGRGITEDQKKAQQLLAIQKNTDLALEQSRANGRAIKAIVDQLNQILT